MICKRRGEPTIVDTDDHGGPFQMSDITYRYGNAIDLDQVIELYQASTLGDRRPVDNRETMADMLHHANLVVTAWDGELLIGIARALTDFSYVGYLADLAGRPSYQRQRIGAGIILNTRQPMVPPFAITITGSPQ